MRPRRWVLALVLLALVASVAPAQAGSLPNNIFVVDPSEDPPPDLLQPEEVERIEQLQNAAFPLPFSEVSPNDESVLLVSDDDLVILDLADGATRLIDPAPFERFVPLPLLGFSRFSWLDAETLGVLALDLGATSAEEAFVLLQIDRLSTEIRGETLSIPPDVGLISAAPDLRQLLVVLPPEEATNDDAVGRARAVGVRMILPQLGAAGADPRPEPATLRGAMARARAHPAMARIWGWQEEEDGMVAATPETLDLALINASQPGFRYITTVPEASVLGSETWSDDSRKLAFSLYGLPDGDDPRPNFDGARFSDEVYRDVTGNLPPSLNPLLQKNNTYLVDAASGATQILRSDAGAAPPLLFAESWAPDGAHLLVSAWYPARLQGRTHPIYVPQFSERSALRVYNSELRQVGQLQSNLFSGSAFASVVAEMVSPDEVLFRASGANRHLYYWNRVSGELRNLADRAGSYFNVFSTHQSRQVVFTHASYSNPPDVYQMGWDGKGLARLTWLNEELRLLADLREDVVSFRLPGGVVREGVLIQPASAAFPPRNVPIVVWQEGGPGVAMNNLWATNVEAPFALLPGMGVALLVTPVAGRPGVTPTSFNSLADRNNFGAIDIDEQAAIAREMIRRGWTSSSKLGITGCSYGGYFTLQSVTRHPDLYAAANPQCGFVDLFTEWSRGYASLAPYLMGLPPYNIPEEYRRDSPAYNANRIKAALLTFHGTLDFLPMVQNENIHLRLVNNGVPARMVRFVDEGHGLASPDNQLYAAQEQVQWFRTHLR